MDSIPKYGHSQISNRKGKMAGTYKIKIEYACGHTTEYNSDVQRSVQKIDADCPACRKKQQKEAEQKKEESQLNKEQLTRSAPKLKGSVKQIEFAEKNRNRFIAYWSNPEKGATYKQVPVIKNIIKNEKKYVKRLTYILRLINIYNTKENISLKILEGDKNVKKKKNNKFNIIDGIYYGDGSFCISSHSIRY